MFQSFGLEFVPNNYATPLSTENVPEAFHLFQNFLAQSDIGHALVAPAKLSGSQIKAFWETGVYDDGGESGTPSIIFEFVEEEYIVTPTTVRDALGCEDFNAFTISVGDSDLQRMMREIGYSGSLARTGNLNLQIGYSLLYGAHFDYARLVLNNIGEKMTENRSVVYFSRFCQLIFSMCVDGVEIAEEDVIPSFKLHKRIFSDLTNKDVKKGNVDDLMLPASVQQFLNPQPQPQAQPEPIQPLNSEPLPSTSQKPKAGGRTKHRAFKVSKSLNTDDVPKRKLVAAYLFDGLIPGSTSIESPEVVIEDATVSEEARADTDNNDAVNDDFIEPILEMDFEDEIEAHPSATLEEFGTKAVAAENIIEETAENSVEEIAEIVVESTAVHAENEENAQDNINSEKLANADAQEIFAETIPHSSNAKSSTKSDDGQATKSDDDQADSSSQRISAQQNSKDIQHATELHYQNMYFSKWSNKDCIFTDQRAADFVTNSAASITNPELLTHLKATIVQVKSLHNRFDETQKSVTGLRNDVVARDMSLKQDKSMLLTLVKDQEVLKNRLTKVEDNQTVMSDKLDSIAASIELLTSVLLQDDVKKGERVLKDKCKKSQTLSRQDDSTDGGAKGKDFKSKSTLKQGKLRSNSDATNSERINTGAQSSSRARSLLLTSHPVTDEEIAAQLFLEEHGADATIQDIQAEELMLAKEHEQNLKSGKVKKVVKVSRPKEKGIVIKENVNSQQSLQQAKKAEETSSYKGKGKLVEESVQKKAQTTSDNAQVVKT
ncbi:hypothetical protein POM88_012629 [Heracleum sosnowskyi]|uniref:Uncharacterized protein n=1 Tax=Heracleum sosnowskyi TaxID=360622 RepID=A0AAD8N3L5_9APIA|nr:hypothetical protein POM88_012629 [Heracleum sosnowskyi]